MTQDKKLPSAILVLALLAFTLVGIGLYSTDNIVEGLTGSFTDAHQTEEPSIEEIYWEFGENKTAYGSMVRQNFSEGRHNVTLVVEKSNGEVERHRGEAVIE
ncbi:MAG: hypothetical protein R6V35_00870 [Candidatus Nanohaloarchaea archaeon]